MHRHMGGEEYTVTLRAMPADVPPANRLRSFLKAALRQYRLRAVSVREVTPPLPPLRRPEGNAEAAG